MCCLLFEHAFLFKSKLESFRQHVMQRQSCGQKEVSVVFGTVLLLHLFKPGI